MWLHFLVVLLSVAYFCYVSEFFQIIDPVSFRVNLPEKLERQLGPDHRLDKVERLFENQLHWPESFAVFDNKVYTGLGDGRIVRIDPDQVTTICRIGDDCAGQHEEHICGRPLGMEFDKNGLLYVVDAYLGLFTVNVKTGEKKNILPSSTTKHDKPLTFLNDLAIDEKEKVIYLTQSTTKWNISMVLMSIVEHESSGRLLKYNMASKQISVLNSGLSFPNGVELTHDKSALLVAMGSKKQIFKYQLQGKNKGRFTPLPLVLPGEPDNISKHKGQYYWVGIATARSLESPSLLDRFAEKPFYRKIFLYAYRLFTYPIGAFLSLLPHKQAKEFGFELKNGRILADLQPVHGMIIQFDDEGNVVQIMDSPSGKAAFFSEVLLHDNHLYLGSWRNKYLGRIRL